MITWGELIRPKIVRALELLSPLEYIMHEIRNNPTALTRDIQTLGDAVLTGETSQKLVFWKLDQINAHLNEHYAGLIEEEVRAGKDTSDIIGKLTSLMQMTRDEKTKESSESWGGAAEGMDTMAAPKRGQLRRALAEASYAALELKYLPVLQAAGQPDKDVQDLLSDKIGATQSRAPSYAGNTPGGVHATHRLPRPPEG